MLKRSERPNVANQVGTSIILFGPEIIHFEFSGKYSPALFQLQTLYAKDVRSGDG